MEGATEGALDPIAFPGMNTDELREAFGAVGVSTSQDTRRGVVLCSVLLIAYGALQNLYIYIQWSGIQRSMGVNS